jgi:hypothetical protein
VEYRYRSLLMGFGLEGVNGNTGSSTRAQVASQALRWLLDKISLGPIVADQVTHKRFALSAPASSSVGAGFTRFRSDFRDRTGGETTSAPSDAQVQAPRDVRRAARGTDVLGHRALTKAPVSVPKH